MTSTLLAPPPGKRGIQLIDGEPAQVHELEVLHDELELLHREVRATLGAVEKRNLELIRGLQQTIGQHLADHPHYPARGWLFARRAREMLEEARRSRDGTGKIIRASKVLDQLVEEAWVQL